MLVRISICISINLNIVGNDYMNGNAKWRLFKWTTFFSHCILYSKNHGEGMAEGHVPRAIS